MSEIREMFDPAAEAMSIVERRELQNQRLREMLRRVAHIPFYQQQWAEHGVNASDIRTTDDVAKLPFTTKEDLRREYPLGLLAVPRCEVVRYHASSGTTGKPTMVAYTAGDIATWSELCARFLVSGGLRKHHTVQIAFGYGLFTGGFGLHYGVERVGAAVVPAAAGNTQRQIMLMRDLEVDALVCTPSYALTIAEAIHTANLSPSDLNLSLAFLGGEPWTERMRETLESLLPVNASNNYGLSEVIGPGVSGECPARRGMHIQEDHVFVECLDPVTLKPVPDGTPGELVFTSLTREAMPIVRYRTRDIAALFHCECSCGRTTCRMSRVTGRSDDMMIIRGVNVYPSQIEGALLSVSGAAPHYQIELTRPRHLDEARVRVELAPEAFSDKVADMANLKTQLDRAIYTVTGLHIEIELLAPGSLQRFEGKAQRVIDKRMM